MPLTREEKFERKKLSERRRRERLKHNKEFKAKNRARYYKRKAEGKILSEYEELMTPKTTRNIISSLDNAADD